MRIDAYQRLLKESEEFITIHKICELSREL